MHSRERKITEFASWLSIPGMEVITLRNTSIACTDLFLFEKQKGYIEVRIKNDNDNNRDTNLNQRITSTN